MNRSEKLFFNDIIGSVDLVEEYISGKTFEDFSASSLLQDAVLRRIEIIGEAVKNISDETKNKHSGIPWKNIAGTRDVLTHEYFGVNLERIWKTAEEDLPLFKKQVLDLKGELKNG